MDYPDYGDFTFKLHSALFGYNIKMAEIPANCIQTVHFVEWN